MSTLGVCCFSSCRILSGPSPSAWVFLWSVIRRFECLAPTLQRCHHLSSAHDRTMTVVSSSGKYVLVLCVLFPDDNISDVNVSSVSLTISCQVRMAVPLQSDSIRLHIVRAIRADIDINHNYIIIFEQFSTPPCIRWSVR